MDLALSLFPGIGLLDRGFEAEGFAVARGPDLLWGGDVRRFHVPSGRFDGIIGGSPCQGFSRALWSGTPGADVVRQVGIELLGEFVRVVREAQPDWWLLENVPTVPDVVIPGYTWQRVDLNARECGMGQERLRHFQFGCRSGQVISPVRLRPTGAPEPACLATKKEDETRSFSEFCVSQGLPSDFDLPGFRLYEKFRAVGNGVPVPMARTMARAVRERRLPLTGERFCYCSCGRLVVGGALPGCRKRVQRQRDRVPVTDSGAVTLDLSRWIVTQLSA